MRLGLAKPFAEGAGTVAGGASAGRSEAEYRASNAAVAAEMVAAVGRADANGGVDPATGLSLLDIAEIGAQAQWEGEHHAELRAELQKHGLWPSAWSDGSPDAPALQPPGSGPARPTAGNN